MESLGLAQGLLLNGAVCGCLVHLVLVKALGRLFWCLLKWEQAACTKWNASSLSTCASSVDCASNRELVQDVKQAHVVGGSATCIHEYPMNT